MNRTAAVFAGQGAQAVGMGRDLAEAFPACRKLFDRADEVLGFPLSRICFEGPETELTRTRICQPAIFVASAACHQALLLQNPGVAFDVAAGLSLGEWTALYAAGAVSFEQALRILEARGRFMQEACDERPGGMVSVMRLALDQVRAIADPCGLTVANLNSAEQVVLSGPREGVVQAEQAVKAAGGRAVVLNVAGAYHSPLMASAAEKLAAVLAKETLQKPSMPVLSNVTGRPHGDPDSLRSAMVAQVTHSVLWLDSVNWCSENGIERYVEFGPGKTLTGLIRRIAPAAATFNVADAAQAQATAAAL